jgi:O-antigen chain-terminating methyltransferase
VVEPGVGDEAKIAELRSLVEAIRDRVRAQYPETSAVVDSGGPEPIRVPFADLMPIVHARDAAQAKMASIGQVNPRAGGLINGLIQTVKQLIARSLNWLVRDQIVFNRGALACVEATVESLNDLNRALGALAGQIDARLQQDRHAVESRFPALEARSQDLSAAVGQMGAQWQRLQHEWAVRDAARDAANASAMQASREAAVGTWTALWDAHQAGLRERDLARDGEVVRLEAEFRRAVSQFELRAADHEQSYAALAKAQHAEFAQLSRTQHAEFEVSLERAAQALQKKLDEDLRRIKLEFEKVIHQELRVVRQRGMAAVAPVHSGIPLDYQAFSERFRGSEAHVLGSQKFYAGRFQGEVLDIGCGHGEFLEVMRESGVAARGIDLSADSVAYCRAKGLEAEQADLFAYLDALPDKSLDGIFSSQVVEHLAPNRIPEMVRLCAAKLCSGGLLALETPNPACLAIFATHFYLDPTHVRPVPSALLAFYMEENGLGGIEVVERFPASEAFPELGELPEGVRAKFFGGLDYAIFGRKL